MSGRWPVADRGGTCGHCCDDGVLPVGAAACLLHSDPARGQASRS